MILYNKPSIARDDGTLYNRPNKVNTTKNTKSTSKKSSKKPVSQVKPISKNNSSIKKGSTGSSVKDVQNMLSKLGYNIGKIDGIFGPKTEKAVRAFQQSNKLAVDGIVGPKTMSALKNSYSKKNVNTKKNSGTKKEKKTPIKTDTKSLSGGYIEDYMLVGSPEYAIYLDSTRVDYIVKSFSTQTSVDGSIGVASVEFMYAPMLYKRMSAKENIAFKDEQTFVSRSNEIGEGIENMTNLRIFVKNMFSGKYCCVFDGNVRAKSLSRTPDGFRLSFSAADYLTWFHRTIVPLAIPLEDKPLFPDRLRWRAQGLNVNNVKTVATYRDLHFRGKTIKEVWDEVRKATLDINMLYKKSDVAMFDNATKRVIQMADIDPKYTKEQKVLDFTVTSSATSVNSIYVFMNNLVKTMMLEFFQDRDGSIKIKAPFWSQPVLKSYVIDPLMILGFTESTNWDAEYSRVIATGGLEWWESDYDSTTQKYVTPVAVCTTDEIVSNSMTGPAGGASGGSTDPINVTGGVTGTWLDNNNYKITGYYQENRGNHLHGGVDWSMPNGTPLKHLGSRGVVSRVQNAGKNGYGLNVRIRITEGAYNGYTIIYAHLSSAGVAEGATVFPGSIIGNSGGIKGGPTSGNSSGPHLHFEVRNGEGKTINPIIYLQATAGQGSNYGYNIPVGNDKLLLPTYYEKKYGLSILEVNQPMIKFSTSGAIDSNRATASSALENYSKFMLHYLNSLVNTATLNTVAMPWIRPGFNIWIDPIGIDKIYYVNSISFQGDANSGVYMSMGLTMGRTLDKFVNGESPITSLKSNISGSIFVNQLKKGYEVKKGDFGKIIGVKEKDYLTFRNNLLKCHMSIAKNQHLGSIESIVDMKNLFYTSEIKFLLDMYSDNKNPLSSSEPNKNDDKNNSVKKPNISAWRNILRRGSRGNDVGELQQLLIDLGYKEAGKVDKIFGQKTEKAVIRFQKEHKSAGNADGIVGKKTKAALAEA